MKGWHVVDKNLIEEKTIDEHFDSLTCTKVKITKALLTLKDAITFSEGENKGFVLGGYGIGVVSEAGENLFNLQKGTRVYINPTLSCNKCYNCENNEHTKCTDVKVAGEDFNGFLRDFISIDSSNLYYLPESVSDNEALFINHICLSLAIIDKLDIQKGDHVAIIGASNLGIILSQLLIYYQAVPILIDIDDESLQIAKSSGIYYTLGKDDNWPKEVSSLTGGRMAKSVVYISDCDVSARTAFTLAGYNAPVAITGLTEKNATISIAPAMKKQLVVHLVNSGYGYTASSINLIANKAFNIKPLKLDFIPYAKVPEKLAEMSENLSKEQKIYDCIVDVLE